MQRSAPHSRPASDFIIFNRRAQRCLRSLKCVVKLSVRSNVMPTYLYVVTTGMISLLSLSGMSGSTCLGFLENISVADLVGDINSPHLLHQSWI